MQTWVCTQASRNVPMGVPVCVYTHPSLTHCHAAPALGRQHWGQVITQGSRLRSENEARLHLYELFCIPNYPPFAVMCLHPPP